MRGGHTFHETIIWFKNDIRVTSLNMDMITDILTRKAAKENKSTLLRNFCFIGLHPRGNQVPHFLRKKILFQFNSIYFIHGSFIIHAMGQVKQVPYIILDHYSELQ
jgi:hypothetical protein